MNKFLDFICSPRFYVSIFVIAVAVVIWIGLKKTISFIDDSKSKENSTFRNGALTVTKTLLMLITVFAVLQINNINVTTVVASLGIVSAVVGLALQDFFKDIIMGINMRLDSFFKVFDVVLFNGRECQVIYFSARTVKLKDIYNGDVISVCNRNISQITVLSDIYDIHIPLSYEDSAKKIYPILEEICKEISTAENVTDCEFLGTYEFESSDIAYKIRIRCNPEYRATVKLDAMRIIQSGLDKAGITIPYQQIDIHQKQ